MKLELYAKLARTFWILIYQKDNKNISKRSVFFKKKSMKFNLKLDETLRDINKWVEWASDW